MNTKECIEFLGLWKGNEENTKQIDEVIKHLRIWESFKKKYGYYLVGIKENKLKDSLNIGDLMNEFEEKCFPKPIENTITMRLECNNFNAIDKKRIEDWINWLDKNNIKYSKSFFKTKECD